jgi:hypothetical protein
VEYSLKQEETSLCGGKRDDAGLLANRELYDALGLSATAGESLACARTGGNGRHASAGCFGNRSLAALRDTTT